LPPPPDGYALAAGQSARLSAEKMAAPLAAAREAVHALAVHRALRPLAARLGLLPLLQRIEWPLVAVLADMELAGMPVDPVAVHEQLAAMKSVQEELHAAVVRVAQDASMSHFAISTPSHIGELLWERLRIPPPPNVQVRLAGHTATCPSAAPQRPVHACREARAERSRRARTCWTTCLHGQTARAWWRTLKSTVA
jgi:DNA polymerase I-like protein with 3'-5' exonuclease and polymerase domains